MRPRSPLGPDYRKDPWAVASETNAAIDLLTMLAIFVCPRLYLYLVQVRHFYPGGYLVHHLFLEC